MQSFAEIKSLSASYLNAFGVDLLDDNKVQIGHRIKPTSVFNNVCYFTIFLFAFDFSE